MAEKTKSGGWFFWLILGVLVGVALTLAALMFLNAGPVNEGDVRTTADDAAASAIQPATEPARLPPPAAEKAPAAPPQHDAGIDPHSDDQIAEDAAAAGMTSRPPSPEGE